MIQVSSPTQGPSPAQGNAAVESNAVGNNENSSVFARAQKKNRPGVFAKLLEGLTVKLKMGGSGNSGGSENSEIKKTSPERVEKNTLKTASNTKKSQNFSFTKDIPDGEGLDDRLFAIFRQDFYSEALQTEPGDQRSPRKLKELPLAGENLTREINRKDDFTDLSASGPFRPSAKEGEFPGSGKSGNRLGGDGREQPNLSGDKVKNTRNAGFPNSSREVEADFFRNQSLHAKPALTANQMPQGLERENSRFQELRGKKGKERPNIEVRDLRTGETRNGASVLAENSAGLREAGAYNSRPLSAEIEIPVDLSLHEGRGEAAGTAAGKNGDSSRLSFEDALAAELRGNLSTDIVRDATVIVRNGGEGTIRLSLRPASLGDVKIRLEMTENKITGHIILQSDEALRAFERELPVLEKAFRDSGFSETNLEMFLAQDNGNFGGQQQGQEGSFLAQVLAASRYEAESESVVNRMEASSDSGEFIRVGMDLPSSPGRTPVNLLV